MTMTAEILDYYRHPGPMTSAGRHADVLQSHPGDIEDLAKVVQGVLLHEHWAPAYGQVLSDQRRSDTHLRPAAAMLDRAVVASSEPVHVTRGLEERIVGTCRNFSVLMVALLRAHGIPARARCGFATYFDDASFVDHWVAEYWSAADQRWKMVDAQVDAFQQDRLTIDFDLFDVPRDRFLVAGEAWQRCRSGAADPYLFGIMDMRGLWFVAGNLYRDLASLNNVEMLPWDTWGCMPEPDDAIPAEHLADYDRLAAATLDPDNHLRELREFFTDSRFFVPDVVYNAVRGTADTVSLEPAR